MSKERGVYQVSLKVILKNKNGEVLVLRTKEDSSYRGENDFPGGRIDADEFDLDFMEVLSREIKEEAGDIKFRLSPEPVSLGRHFAGAKFSRFNKDIKFFYVFFVGEYIDGEISISDEHTSYQWLKLEDIKPEDYFISGILEGVKGYIKMQKNIV